jgi:hypothetical protein
VALVLIDAGGASREAVRSAITHDNNIVLAALLKADPSLANTEVDGDMPLYHATNSTHATVERTKLLLAAGADPNAAGRRGTALHAAGRDADIVRTLLQGGARPDIVDRDGVTPLSMACDKNWPDIVELLLDAGADVQTCDPCFWEPLAAAKGKGRTAIARALGGGAKRSHGAMSMTVPDGIEDFTLVVPPGRRVAVHVVPGKGESASERVLGSVCESLARSFTAGR